MILLGAAVGLGALTAASDFIIRLLYDPRYHDAGIILPMLLVTAWLAILGTVNEYMLLGVSKLAMPTYANGAKFLSYAVATPVAFHYFGFFGAILALAVGEGIKYVSLWIHRGGTISVLLGMTSRSQLSLCCRSSLLEKLSLRWV